MVMFHKLGAAVKVDHTSYHETLKACQELRLWETAMHLLAEMEATGETPRSSSMSPRRETFNGHHWTIDSSPGLVKYLLKVKRAAAGGDLEIPPFEVLQ